MKIENELSILISDIPHPLVEVTAAKKSESRTVDFLEAYFHETRAMHERYFGSAPTKLTIAICTIENNETWKGALLKLSEEGWRCGSLYEWRIFATVRSTFDEKSIILPGVRCRDEELIEYTVIAKQRKKIFKKVLYEINTKPSAWIDSGNYECILISKIEEIHEN